MLIWPDDVACGKLHPQHDGLLRRDLRLIRRARQQAAKQELISKIGSLQLTIESLEGELQEWRSWFFGGRSGALRGTVDEEVRSRVKLIEPVIAEKVRAANEGRSPAICGNTRLRRNVAEHVFDYHGDIATAGVAELNKLQRGARPIVWDPFELLAGMAALPSLIVNAGALLLTSRPHIDDYHSDVESEHGAHCREDDGPHRELPAALADDAACQVPVGAVPTGGFCVDPALVERPLLPSPVAASLPPLHGFQVGDLVLLGDEPAKVIRVGFGRFDGDVRVLRGDEDPSDWRSGLWFPSSQCVALQPRIRMEFTVMTDIVPLADDMTPIVAGSTVRFVDFDCDGDLWVRILDPATATPSVFIRRAHFFRLRLRRLTAP